MMFVSDYIDLITRLYKNRIKELDITFRIYSQYQKKKDYFNIWVEKIDSNGNSKTVGEIYIENAKSYFLTSGDGMFDIDTDWSMVFEV
jgi:hypothetical protein